ncbi:hypothetical protein O3P69_001746 [Scylla paramamosain]|uniref:Uncharacterized protein n=1 Tax=Scylla paramamosain TaxID=85552 RepID=A0AAW0V447_SCYPA
MYSCNLTAFLTVTRQPPTVDTFEDLQKSHLSVFGLGPYYGNLMRASDSSVMQDLAKRFVSLNTGVETWILEGRGAYMSSSNVVKYDAARLNAAYGRPVVTVMKESKANEETVTEFTENPKVETAENVEYNLTPAAPTEEHFQSEEATSHTSSPNLSPESEDVSQPDSNEGSTTETSRTPQEEEKEVVKEVEKDDEETVEEEEEKQENRHSSPG